MIKHDNTLTSIKMMALDMMNNSGVGFDDSNLSSAAIIYSLYLNELDINVKKGNWFNRDRFVVSSSHASALLYATLFYAGYDYTLEDLKRFSTVDSYTPGLPELNPSLGIDASTSLDGMGIANAVGLAMSERYLQSICQSINPKSEIINYYTYVLCSLDDINCGVSYESFAIASEQKLNKLIFIIDANNMDDNSPEDLEVRFEALDYNVLVVSNGQSVSEITRAIRSAKKSEVPSVIIVSNKENNITDEDEIPVIKEKLGFPREDFYVNEKAKEEFSNLISERVAKKFNKWVEEYNAVKTIQSKTLHEIISLLDKGDFYVNFDCNNYKINDGYMEDKLISNQKVINIIAPKTHFFLGASAGKFNETKTIIRESGLFKKDNPSGRNIDLGSRYQGLSGIVNGIALNNLHVYCSSYLSYSDYFKSSMRAAAMQNLPVTYIFTLDNNSYYKGPMYNSNDYLSSLRSIPKMMTFRPADIKEVMGAWEYSLKNKGPVAIVLDNDETPAFRHTNGKYVQYGAYVVLKEREHLDGIIIATGSEVKTAIRIADELLKEGIDLRVVSMPSIELFLKQNPTYEDKLLPKGIKIVTLEASNPNIWHRFASDKAFAIGIEEYLVSGKKEDAEKFIEFDYNNILLRIKNIFFK